MRLLYTVVFYLILPFLFVRLYLRGFKNPDFRKRWFERLAIYDQAHLKNVLLFHAVSVGEVESIFPLLKQLLEQQPQLKILVTTTTPTGSARVKAVMGNKVQHVYLPYDTPALIQHFLRHFKPYLAVIVETEIWPNLFAHCQKNKIPLLMINARLSESSCNGYQKLSGLTRPALDAVSFIATQTQEDADRFSKLLERNPKIQVFGNLKFDLKIDPQFIQQGLALRQDLFSNRFVWIIASTHKGEEDIFLKLYPELKKQIPELLLLIVPRRMERFDEVQKLCEKYAYNVVRRTSQKVCTNETDVYLADTIGELKLLYATADVAFVGGSLVAVGGHNILEPIAMGVPVMFGSYMNNFAAIAEGVLAAQAGLQCYNSQQIVKNLLKLYTEPSQREYMAKKAAVFMQQNQGTMDKIKLLIEQFSL